MSARPFTHYCERLSDAFWAEPFNAITNAGFIAAAVIGLILLRRQTARDRPAEVLVALVFAIGIGSFLFHTVPNRWTVLADVIPIQLFMLAYFLLTMRRFFGIGTFAGVGLTLLFLAASAGGAKAAHDLGFFGAGGYVGALGALGLVALVAAWRSRTEPRFAPVARVLALACVVFAVSLTFRQIDRGVCAVLPVGTHFIWHLLNATVLGILIAGAIRLRPAFSDPVS